MIEQYALENPNIKLFGNTELHDAKHIEQLLFSIIMGRGFILIDKNMRGCFIAIKSQNIWCPKVTELHQLMCLVGFVVVNLAPFELVAFHQIHD